MAFLIGGANSSAVSAYDIENSVRMEGTQYMTETLGTPTSDKIFTWSGWFKGINSESGDEYLFAVTDDVDSYTRHVHVRRDGDKQLQCQYYVDSSQIGQVVTDALFRDPNAWYHLVFRFDTTQAVANNRIRMYINGSEISYKTQTMPDQNETLPVSGSRYATASYAGVTHGIDGYLADVAYIDGTSYGPDTFGETDEDSGIWKPKDAKDDLTFGSNGFFLEFKQSGTDTDASGLGADTSGNDTHFASNNLAATDQCTDTPTNNFATLNPLHNFQNDPVYSEGNTKVVFADGGNGASPLSTIALNDGKWYFEAKFVQTSDPGHGAIGVGIVDADQFNVNAQADEFFDRYDYGYSYTTDGEKKTNNSGSSFGDEYNSGDIIGVAVDFDNRQIYFSLNGTFQDSGDPTSGATGTGSAHNFSSAYYYMSVYAYQDENSWEVNFGNPAVAISSSNDDANGYGNFEYAVPSGYYAICSKNLAKYG